MKKRFVIQGEVWFNDEDSVLVNTLIKHQSSSVRSAYQAIHKHKLKGNDVVKYVKKNYMKFLNQRLIQDACVIASGISQEKSIFGGKRNWQNLTNKSLDKKCWINIRNSQLYSRGDKTKNGNPNIRISDQKLLVNDPSQRGKWIYGNLFMPKKFQMDYECYDVRLIRKTNNKFQVIATYEKEIDAVSFLDRNGVIGVDINPDGVALVETDFHGNMINHMYIKKQRIQDAKENKRLNDIRMLAVEVVKCAKSLNKPLVIEKLKIDNKKNSYKKFNRIKHNFIYRKIIDAIISRGLKERVSVREVEPAFTSILGNLKYKNMYSLNRHTAAALVIARRGMGIREKQTFSVTQVQKADKKTKANKVMWNLEGRRMTIDLSQKSWSWLSSCFLKPKPVTHTESHLDQGNGIGCSMGEIPMGESTTKTDRCGSINYTFGAERTPCKIFQSY